jgi:hypothetical protein
MDAGHVEGDGFGHEPLVVVCGVVVSTHHGDAVSDNDASLRRRSSQKTRLDSE